MIPMAQPRTNAFTIIEMLIVILILMLLVGMLMPMLNITKRSAAITNTKGLLKRVSTALDAFRADVGAYPYQDHSSGSFPEANRLGFHLTRAMTASELTDLRADAAMASGRYDASSSFGTMVLNRTHIDMLDSDACEHLQSEIAAHINRLASTRARVAIFAGVLEIKGIKAFGGYDQSASRLVPSPAESSATPGFASDYLTGDISKSEISGNQIVDRWGKPLIYVSPVVPGVHGYVTPGFLSWQTNDPRQWVTTQSAPINESAYGLQVQGRAVTTSLASDIRTTASAAWRNSPELWSSGPDRKAQSQRDDLVNRDNISAERYTRDLK